MSPGSILNCAIAVVALEADRGDAVPDVEPFGVDHAISCLIGRAVAVDHLLHAEVGDRRPAGRRASRSTVPKNQKPVSATPTKSLPGVGEAERRQRAEIACPARSSPARRRIRAGRTGFVAADAKGGDRPGGDLDLFQRRSGSHRRDGKGRGQREAGRSPPGAAHRKSAAAALPHPARRRPRRLSRALSSPNSEASCSVIAPASSSASTMVTARR